jgi:hypothetical protein
MAEPTASWDEFPVVKPAQAAGDHWAEFPLVDAPPKRGGIGGAMDYIAETFNNPPREPSLIGMAGELYRGVKTAAGLGSGAIDPSTPEGATAAVETASQFLPLSPAMRTGKLLARAAEGRPVADAALTAPKPGPFGVTLSEGQETGELPKIQFEQAALRKTVGSDAAHARAQQFADQQKEQIETAKTGIAKSLDPFGAQIADTPQEAGELVSGSLSKTAAQAKAGVKQAYDEAKSYPGEVHAGAFEGIAQKIKGDLSLRPDPIIIDDKLTPFASQAIKDVDERIAQLKIQNRADPFEQPRQENIVGISLAGVDQMRKRLSTFRKDAFSSGNAADGRAAKAVLDAFDNHVDAAMEAGLFKGDPRAIKAWKDARAAYADYSKAFTAGKNDPVGRVVEKILGKGVKDPAIANDVADFMYGSSGVNPSSLNVGVANRVKSILGAQSPEWSAVKQGLFHRLVDAGEGATQFGPGKVAQRLSKFLRSDGKELSEAVFSSPERAMLWRYAGLMRKLEVPQSGANWSNTASFQRMNAVGGKIGMAIGVIVGNAMGLGLIGEAAGAGAAKTLGMVPRGIRTRQIAKQMPLVSEQFAAWQKATARAASKPSRPTQMAATAATTKLARTLAEMGLDFTKIGQADGADPDQKQIQRPPGQ